VCRGHKKGFGNSRGLQPRRAGQFETPSSAQVPSGNRRHVLISFSTN
jgi:hypothetical protein